jgi:outer membrane immunogenic protein
VQSGVFVFGVEGEWMWTGIKGGQTFTDAFGGASQTITLETSIDWLAIARAGFVVGDKLLLYGKAAWRSRKRNSPRPWLRPSPVWVAR